jgi:hypothetical protein
MKFEVRTKKPVPSVSMGESLRPPRGVAPGTQPSGKVVLKKRKKATGMSDKTCGKPC